LTSPSLASGPSTAEFPLPRLVPLDELELEDLDEEEPDTSHTWCVAANIPVDGPTAKFANMRTYYVTKKATRVAAVDVYCDGCRRTFEDADGTPCSAKAANRQHLIGGDPAHRKKRKLVEPPPGARIVAGPLIDRTGLSGYSVPDTRNRF
jgi:hypothetical protein